MIRTYLYGFGLLAMLLAFAWVYSLGREHEAGAHAREALELRDMLDDARRDADRRELARLAAEAERDALAKELEDAALADPGADGVALGVDSVRRIDRR